MTNLWQLYQSWRFQYLVRKMNSTRRRVILHMLKEEPDGLTVEEITQRLRQLSQTN
jgi:hypothetical protein